jgi:aminoglycoside 6'-N-acetyltransferase I
VIGVRPVAQGDADAWLTMRRSLWPEEGEQYHPREIAKFLDGGPSLALAVLVAEEDGEVLGFAELSVRAYAEGCHTNGVGFLEGWYVVPAARRRGIGRALVLAAEDWARTQGCTEFASNALANNELSQLAHHAVGFEEVEIVRCFRKSLKARD